jgi:hypothetical protein
VRGQQRGRRSRGAVGLAFVCAAALGLGASTASAQVVSNPGSNIFQSINYSCPEGFSLFNVLNAGILDASPSVALRAVKYVGEPAQLKVVGEETDPVPENWRVSALAGCVQGGDFIYVTRTSPLGSATTQSVTATCPPGSGNWGGGADITGGGPDVALRAVVPVNGAPQSWTVTAEETDEVASNWSVTAQAVCAFTDPGYIYSPPTVTPGSSATFQTAIDGCEGQHRPPQTDTIQTGGGQVLGPTDVTLRAMKMVFSGQTPLWAVDGQETDPVEGGWQVASHGNCVPL